MKSSMFFLFTALLVPVAIWAMNDCLKPSKAFVNAGEEFYITAHSGTHVFSNKDEESQKCVEYKNLKITQDKEYQEIFSFIAKKTGCLIITCTDARIVRHRFAVEIK